MTQKEHNMKGPLRVSYIHTFEYNKSEKRREREREREFKKRAQVKIKNSINIYRYHNLLFCLHYLT